MVNDVLVGNFETGVTVIHAGPGDPPVAGYRFDGWDFTGGTPANVSRYSFTMPAHAVVMNAVWLAPEPGEPFVPGRRDLLVEFPVSRIPIGATNMRVAIYWDGIPPALDNAANWDMDASNTAQSDYVYGHYINLDDSLRIFDTLWNYTCGWGNPDPIGEPWGDNPDVGIRNAAEITISAPDGFVPSFKTEPHTTHRSGRRNESGVTPGGGLASAAPNAFIFWLIPGATWYQANANPDEVTASAGFTSVPSSGNISFTLPNVLHTQAMFDGNARLIISFEGNGVRSGNDFNFSDVGGDFYTHLFDGGGFAERELTVTAPAGIYYAADSSSYYAPGEVVTVFAGFRLGYRFTGWTVEEGDLDLSGQTGNSEIIFVMPDDDVSLIANFEALTATERASARGRVDSSNASDAPTMADVTMLIRFLNTWHRGSFAAANPNFNINGADVRGTGNISFEDVTLLRLHIASPANVPMGPPNT